MLRSPLRRWAVAVITVVAWAVVPAAPVASAASEVVLINGLPLQTEGARLAGCAISVDVSGLTGTTETGVPVSLEISAVAPTVPEGTVEVLVTEQATVFEATWHREVDMTSILLDYPAKPNGYRLSVSVSIDSVEAGSITVWLACGAAQEGHPARILFEVAWLDARGDVPVAGPLDQVMPAGWRDDYRLTAASERGTASCSYPPASDVLVCAYDNPGHGTQPGMVVPGGKKHEYTVTQTGLPLGWTVDASTLGTFLGRDTCPPGEGHHGDEAAAEPDEGEGSGRTCVHQVVNLRLAPPPPPPAPPPEPTPAAVVAGDSQSPETLPITGTASTSWLVLALALLATGVALQRVSGRRPPGPASPHRSDRERH